MVWPLAKTCYHRAALLARCPYFADATIPPLARAIPRLTFAVFVIFFWQNQTFVRASTPLRGDVNSLIRKWLQADRLRWIGKFEVEPHRQSLAGRVRPRLIGSRTHAFLRPLRNLPIFPVRGVPEFHGVIRSEIWLGHFLRMEIPLADDSRSVHRQRPQAVRHHVV